MFSFQGASLSFFHKKLNETSAFAAVSVSRLSQLGIAGGQVIRTGSNPLP